MREDAKDYFHRMSGNPHWEYYMKQIFPTMISYTPGGLNYDMTKSIEERVDAWVEQQEICITWCMRLDIRTDGYKGGFLTPDHAVPNALHYSVSSRLRKCRRQWKRTMDIVGWNYDDALWRRVDGRDQDVWAQEWRIFRQTMHNRYGDQQRELNVEMCCD
uniref:Uncharacterized protein n=1 Tax=Pseudomonas phage RVTF4 TaxID=3236931 RepID=A0AB39CCM2_9VIRU